MADDSEDSLIIKQIKCSEFTLIEAWTLINLWQQDPTPLTQKDVQNARNAVMIRAKEITQGAILWPG